MTNIDNVYTEIRCGAVRPHYIYNRCGGLLGGVDVVHPSTSIKICPICGLFWIISVTAHGSIEMEEIARGKRILFKKQWRTIKDAE